MSPKAKVPSLSSKREPQFFISVSEPGWIIDAIAHQWTHFIKNTLKRPVSLISPTALPECGHPEDTYIHFIYLSASIVSGSRNLVYVTHVDYSFKLLTLLKLSLHGAEFITMSHQSRRLVSRVVGSSSVHSVNPWPIHPAISFGSGKKPFRLGLFFRLYSDGRKADKVIAKLLSEVNKSQDSWEVLIYGTGFEKILPRDRSENIIYDSTDFNPKKYREYLLSCDYVAYFGCDEGAISILDAAALGVPIIATDQGYHRDIKLPLGSVLQPDSLGVYIAIRTAAARFFNEIPSSTSLRPVLLDSQPGKTALYRAIALPWGLLGALIIALLDNPFRARDDLKVSLRQLGTLLLRRAGKLFKSD